MAKPKGRYRSRIFRKGDTDTDSWPNRKGDTDAEFFEREIQIQMASTDTTYITSPTRTNLILATLLKQLRSVASLQLYEIIVQQGSMNLLEQQRKIYDIFHGNVEINMISQLERLVNGRNSYANIYDIENRPVQTDKETEPPSSSTGVINPASEMLIIKNVFLSRNDVGRYIAGDHFNEATVAAPAKTKPNELASGRHILDLAKLTLKNVKKAVAFAEDWLNDGSLPSGTTWDDLYTHVLVEYGKMNPKENEMFLGFMAFVCLTKYNDVGINQLTVLGTSDDMVVKDGRAVQRKKESKEKEMVRSSKPIGIRGIGLDRQLQVIEIVQLEDCKKIDNITETIKHLTSQCDIVLRERSQQIELAKLICPKYDKNDENWASVAALTQDLRGVKEEIAKYEKEKIEIMRTKSASLELTKELLNDIYSMNESNRKPRKIQKHGNNSDISSSITSGTVETLASTDTCSDQLNNNDLQDEFEEKGKVSS